MDVVLAVLPFADVDRPAIGVSLLKAEVERQGCSARVVYCNLDLAELIGVSLCTQIAEALPSETLVGEWFFADLLFGDRIPHSDDYVEKMLRPYAPAALVEEIVRARRSRGEFIDRALARITRLQPRIVGFTTTFHQTCACLWLARRLKELPNPPVIVFGGANCEGEMGLQLLRSFPEIDYVCTREGDVAFPALVRQLLRNGRTSAVPGILRQGDATELTTPDLIRDLDDLPYPDYTDYFERLSESPLAGEVKPNLFIETARGCWWGAKHHCTFCGLNGDTMEFRAKSVDRAFEEFRYLHDTYGVKRIDCVDNILHTRYIGTLFPRLRDSGLDLEIFYEVKANLRLDQLKLMADGGVRFVQPGIESFSNEVLRLMKKGTTGLQNIQLLRWCAEVGILPAWNILAGFPSESVSEYQRTADLLPLLFHLPQPASCSPIRLDRFSPFFVSSTAFGLQRVRATSAYYYVYPFGRRELDRLAYFFDFEYPDQRKPREYIAPVRTEFQKWWQSRSGDASAHPRLDAAWQDDGDVVVTDTRPCRVHEEQCLTAAAARILWQCDSARTLPALVRRFEGSLTPGEIESAIIRLRSEKLMIEMDEHYGSLPVFRNRPVEELDQIHAYPETAQAAVAQPLLRILRAAGPEG